MTQMIGGDTTKKVPEWFHQMEFTAREHEVRSSAHCGTACGGACGRSRS